MPKTKFDNNNTEPEKVTEETTTVVEGSVEGQVNTDGLNTDIMAQLQALNNSIPEADATVTNQFTASGKDDELTPEEKEAQKRAKAKIDNERKARIGKIQKQSMELDNRVKNSPKSKLRQLKSQYSFIIGYCNSSNNRVDFFKKSHNTNPNNPKEVLEYSISIKEYSPTRFTSIIVIVPECLSNALAEMPANDAEQRSFVNEKEEEIKKSLANGTLKYAFDIIPRKNACEYIRTQYNGYINEAPEIFKPFYIVRKSANSAPVTQKFEVYESDGSDKLVDAKYSHTAGKPGLYALAKTKAKPAKKNAKPESTPDKIEVDKPTAEKPKMGISLTLMSVRPGVYTDSNFIPSQVYKTCDITALPISSPSEASDLTYAYLGKKIVDTDAKVIKIPVADQETDNNNTWFNALSYNEKREEYWEIPEHATFTRWFGGTVDASGNFVKSTGSVKGNKIFATKYKSTSKSGKPSIKAEKLTVVSDTVFNASDIAEQAKTVKFSEVLDSYGSDIKKAAEAYGLSFDYTVWNDANKIISSMNSIGKTMNTEIFAIGLSDEEIKQIYDCELY